MWIGLLALASAVTYDVTDAEESLNLLPDGSVELVRLVTVNVPEPEPVEGDEDEEDVDADSDSGEPEPDVLRVWGLRTGVPATGFTIETSGFELKGKELVVEPISEAVMLARRAEIQAEREVVREAIAAQQERIADADTPRRRDLDFLEAQLAEAATITEVPGAVRAQTDLDRLQAQLTRLDEELVGLLDGDPVERIGLSLSVDPLPPGEHSLLLSRPLANARWTSGYYMLGDRALGDVTTTLLGGLDLPAGTGFDPLPIQVDLGTGAIAAEAGEVGLHPDGGMQPFAITTLDTRYRNLMRGDSVERRVDVTNPLEIPLPATRLGLRTTLVAMNALEPNEAFRLGLGTLTDWRVRQRNGEWDIRTGIAAATPVWIPQDPTGCRIAASGDILGPEEVDGAKGLSVMIAERGVVAFQCR